MQRPVSFFERLGLRQDADDRAIRRAYARELKLIDQEADAEGFQILRAAYEHALHWARQRAAQQPADMTPQVAAVPDAADVPTKQAATVAAPAPTLTPVPTPTSVPAPAAAPAPSMAPTPAIPAPKLAIEEDHAVEAATVFAEFRLRCDTIPSERPALPQAPWIRELERSLNDHRLVAIVVRDRFEHHVAYLLAEGWLPGHEAFLVGAIRVFQWDKDRRRVLRLGQAGAILDAAIREREQYDMQPPELREEQRRVIERLRDATVPSTRQLLKLMPTLELMIARFPNWLALISSASNARTWRKLNAEIPSWRRKFQVTVIREPAPPRPAPKRSLSWKWILPIMVVLILIVAGGSGPSRRPPKPVQRTDHMVEGMRQLNNNQAPQAAISFGQAINADRSNAKAYAYRAAALVLSGDEINAERDLEKAEKLDPSEPMLYRARGLLAKKRKRYDEAIAAFNKALQLQPQHVYTLTQRANVYLSQGDYPRALADADQVLQLPQADQSATQMLRAAALQKLGRKVEAVEAVDHAIAIKPKVAKLYLLAADMYVEWKQRDRALLMLGRGIDATGDLSLYMRRVQLRPASELTARLSDLDHVLRQNPSHVAALRLRAELTFNGGDWKTAAADLTNVLKAQQFERQTKVELLTLRGIIYDKKGETALAQQDFASARAVAVAATELSAICEMMANNNAALTTALEVCNAALERTSANADTLIAKGLILLHLKRNQEAIETYRLAIRYGDQAGAWYGRALARQRVGDVAGSHADAAQARLRGASGEEYFARAGMKLPAS